MSDFDSLRYENFQGQGQPDDQANSAGPLHHQAAPPPDGRQPSAPVPQMRDQ